MAQKRMFTMKIVDSDAFLDMPLTAQCLYFHLNMRADDDGFIGNPKKIMRMIGARDDDYKLLIVKKFIIEFENSVVVIKHWWMHNTLAKDRYHETSYLDEKDQLKLKENKSYTLEGEGIQLKKSEQNVNGMLPNCYQNDNADIDIDSDKELDKDSDINLTPEEKKKNIKPEVELRNIWNENYKKLFNKKPDAHIQDSKSKASYWGIITKQIQNKIQKVGYETVKAALEYAMKEDWIVNADYALTAIFSDNNIANTIAHKPHSKSNKARSIGKSSSDVMPEEFNIPF